MGQKCTHLYADYLKDAEVWLCPKCGEVLKYDPENDDVFEDKYYEDKYNEIKEKDGK